MPVELRKRKAPAEPVPAPPAKKKSNPVKAIADKVKKAVTHSDGAAATNGAKVSAGSTINLDGFGGEIETHDGHKTTLKNLVEQSKSGVVLFTYPKASTPGCTKQACLFRDSYTSLTSSGLSIYGLSNDSPKSNTTFKTKQNLPYTLLCDPSVTLIRAIGLKKAPNGTTRGVFVVDKSGKVLAAEPGSPDGTVQVVRKLVEASATGPTKGQAPMPEPAAALPAVTATSPVAASKPEPASLPAAPPAVAVPQDEAPKLEPISKAESPVVTTSSMAMPTKADGETPKTELKTTA